MVSPVLLLQGANVFMRERVRGEWRTRMSVLARIVLVGALVRPRVRVHAHIHDRAPTRRQERCEYITFLEVPNTGPGWSAALLIFTPACWLT